jgi:hypothetical protein
MKKIFLGLVILVSLTGTSLADSEKQCTFNFTEGSDLEKLPLSSQEMLLNGLKDKGYVYRPGATDNNYQIAISFKRTLIRGHAHKKNKLWIKLFSNYFERKIEPFQYIHLSDFWNETSFDITASAYHTFRGKRHSALSVRSVLEQFKDCSYAKNRIETIIKKFSDVEVVIHKNSLVSDGYIADTGTANLICYDNYVGRTVWIFDAVKFSSNDEFIVLKLKKFLSVDINGVCKVRIDSPGKIPFRFGYFAINTIKKYLGSPGNAFECYRADKTFICKNHDQDFYFVNQAQSAMPVGLY